jgi:gamma-glutamylcyclotransferase
MSPPSTPPAPTLYFAYGSNLSLAQMSSRCPSSTYHSFGLLRGYRWIIGPRGYANVVKSSSTSNATEDVVYGLLYLLHDPEDERALDRSEGVPEAYTKHFLSVTLLSVEESESEPNKSLAGQDKMRDGGVKALVYIDLKRQGEGVCKEEYVGRMNRGIRDAVRKGMPESYVEGVIRPFVREEEVLDEGEGEVEDPFHPDKM